MVGDDFVDYSWQFCSSLGVWCSAAETHLKLLGSVFSGARFLIIIEGLFECDIAHRRSVAVLRMLYKIRCDPMQLFLVLNLGRMCQCGVHAVLWSHICILISDVRTSQYHRTFIPHSVSLWLRSCWPCIDGVRLAGFMGKAIKPCSREFSLIFTFVFYWSKLLYPLLSSTILPVLFFLSIDFYCGAGVFSALHCRLLLLIIIQII